MNISDECLLTGLNELRNAIEHSNYSLRHKSKSEGVTHEFILHIDNIKDNGVIEMLKEDTTNKYRLYRVNPNALYSKLYNAFKLLKSAIEKDDNWLKKFDKKLNLDDWVMM